MSRVAVLIDGSNMLAQLSECGLGYPALAPLIELLRGGDTLAYARFYGAPQSVPYYRDRWQAFRAANRHVPGLDFFQGYRNKAGMEKTIDVALAVDLIYGCTNNHFDRAAIIGGDGDLAYAFKVAKTTRRGLRIYLMPPQPSANLVDASIPFTYFTPEQLVKLGICDRGAHSGVPLIHKAPAGHADITPRLTGAMATLVKA